MGRPEVVTGWLDKKYLTPDDGNTVYTVKPGDTLSAISVRFGISLKELIAANPQIKNPDLIYPGNKINIPGQ